MLLHDVFKGWPHLDIPCSSLDHWKWKYWDNPFKPNVIIVNEEDGRIIGVNHSLGMRVKIGDEVVKSSYRT